MSTWFPKCKEHMLSALMSAANVKAVIVDTGAYTYSAAHEFLSDIPVGARLAATGNLANKSFAAGVFDADDPAAITGGVAATGEAVALYVDTGTPATSRLVLYIDAASAGLPIPITSADILLQWDNGASKIGAL